MERDEARPQFKTTQMISATEASKRFGALRRRAKVEPQAILEHNSIDLVLMSYDDYEEMFKELQSLRSSRTIPSGPASFFG